MPPSEPSPAWPGSGLQGAAAAAVLSSAALSSFTSSTATQCALHLRTADDVTEDNAADATAAAAAAACSSEPVKALCKAQWYEFPTRLQHMMSTWVSPACIAEQSGWKSSSFHTGSQSSFLRESDLMHLGSLRTMLRTS